MDVSIRKPNWRTSRKMRVGTILLGIALLLFVAGALFVVWAIFWTPEALDSHFDKNPIPFNKTVLSEIREYAVVNRGNSSVHQIVLPRSLASGSVAGRAYIDNDYVFVPDWYGEENMFVSTEGRGYGTISGYVYVKDMRKLEKASFGEHVDVYAPVFDFNYRGRHYLAPEIWRLNVHDAVAPHWYKVSSDDAWW